MSSTNRGLSHGTHNKVGAKVPRPTESPPSSARHGSPTLQSRHGSHGDSFGRGQGRSEHWGNAEYGGNHGGRGRGGKGGRRGGGLIVGREKSHHGSHRASAAWKGDNNRREASTSTPSPSRPPNRFSSASSNVNGRGGRGGRSTRPNGGSPNDHSDRSDRLHPVSTEYCEDRVDHPGRKNSASDPKGGDENSWQKGSSHLSFGHAVKRPAPEDSGDHRSATRPKSSDSFPSSSTSGEVGSGASSSARVNSFSVSSSDGRRPGGVETNDVVSVCDDSSVGEGNNAGGGGGGMSSSGKKKKFKKAMEQLPAARRREKQVKELRFLVSKRDEIKARGKDLKAKMSKNQMEQEEIAIQIDAAEKILALYENAEEEANSAARRKEGAEPGAAHGGREREAEVRSERTPTSPAASRRMSSQLEASTSSTRGHLDSGGSWNASRVSTSSTPVRILIDGIHGGSREGTSSRVSSLQPLQVPRQIKASTPARTPAPASSSGDLNPQLARDAASRGESGGSEDFAISLGDRPKSKSVIGKAPGSFDMRKQIMFTTTRTHAARTLAFNPVQHDCFAVCSNDFSLDMWSYTRRGFELEKVVELNNATPTHAGHIAWNSSGTHLAIGHSSGVLLDNCAATIVTRDSPDKLMKLRSHMHTKPASAVAWLPPSRNNQDHLVTGGEDKKVVIWTRVLDPASDLYKVGVLHNKQHTSAVRSACCPRMSSPTVVTGGADGRLVSYSIETSMVKWGELLRVSKEYHPQVNELLEFPNNPNVLLVSAVDTARSHTVFTIDTRQARREIHNRPRMEWKRKDPTKSFSANVYPTLSPCGRYVACAGDWNGCFHLWDVRVERVEPMQSVMVSASARVLHTAWHPDSETKSIFSIASGHGADKKHFALQLHAGLRS